MAQIFHRSTNTISRVSVFGGIGIIVVLVATLAAINRSSYVTEVGVARSQPVQFSHKHHVGDDGIDCRYCHTSVEESSFAGIPSTKICMNCHTPDLGRESDSGAGARKFPNREVAGVDAGPQLAGLRLFRSQHSCSQGRGLHHLPWARGSNAAHVAREHPIYGVVFGVSPQSGAICSAAGAGLQHGLATTIGSDRSGAKTSAGIQDCAAHELFGLSPIKNGMMEQWNVGMVEHVLSHYSITPSFQSS